MRERKKRDRGSLPRSSYATTVLVESAKVGKIKDPVWNFISCVSETTMTVFIVTFISCVLVDRNRHSIMRTKLFFCIIIDRID